MNVQEAICFQHDDLGTEPFTLCPKWGFGSVYQVYIGRVGKEKRERMGVSQRRLELPGTFLRQVVLVYLPMTQGIVTIPNKPHTCPHSKPSFQPLSEAHAFPIFCPQAQRTDSRPPRAWPCWGNHFCYKMTTCCSEFCEAKRSPGLACLLFTLMTHSIAWVWLLGSGWP